MLHARGDVDLPLTGLGAGAEINYVSFDGDSARDIEAYLQVQRGSGLCGRRLS